MAASSSWVAVHDGAGRENLVAGVRREVRWVSGSGPGRTRIRLNRKTPAHLVGLLMHSRPRVWKRLRHVGFSGITMPDHTRRRCDQAYEGSTPAQNRIGWGNSLGVCRPTSPGLHASFN